MRIHFDLKESEPFSFVVGNNTYRFSQLQSIQLARKERIATLVFEYVYKLPGDTYVYLTVVGDDDQYAKNGLTRGWYVAEVLTEKDAKWLVSALAPFTALYDSPTSRFV